MGNEQSEIPGIEIDQRVIEVSDFWTQHSATIHNLQHVSKLSVFVSDLFLNEAFWAPQIALEKFSKNVMIYRHPCIIRYISSWQKANKFYLAVEDVTPLSHVISNMSTMEICLGLYSILKSLCFLHEKAFVSHNNLCLASIFISKEGSWKLGGMEYLCPYKDLTPDYLRRSRNHRYIKAIDTNEDKHLRQSSERKYFIDVFAFCTLVNELLKNRNDADFPNLSAFKEYCTHITQEPNTLQRPKLRSLLENDFFKHKFIGIHSYLIELPLKSDSDRTDFFTNLKSDLELLNEEVIANHLGSLLVSRMVLLNKAARSFLLPYIMVPRNGENGAIFSEEIFRSYLAPKLLKIFGVRDAQIRLLLLEYFPSFIDCFSKEELQMHILPELLVGIKDTNNELVSATLHTLADLVPILGAEIVIGGKRAKLFNDGQPITHSFSRKVAKTKDELSKEVLPSDVDQVGISGSTMELIQNQNELPERPRPDGEEGDTSTDEIEQSVDEDIDNWEDWDENIAELNNVDDNCEPAGLLGLSTDTNSLQIHNKTHNIQPRKALDITELDIKNQAKIELEQSEVNFFVDMEPVIDTSSKFTVDIKKESTHSTVINKLSANADDADEEGWGDDW